MTNKIELLHPLVAKSLQELKVCYEAIECNAALADTAAFLEHYKFAPEETANCIIVAAKSDPITFVCCVIPSNTKLDVNKKVAQLVGIKRCSFASGEQTMTLTEMEIGGVTPFGLPAMPIYMDKALWQQKRIVLGGGNRSSKLLVAPAEFHKLPGMESIEGLSLAR